MKRVHLQDNWPASWRYSYPFDLEEVYGEARNLGYAYGYDNRWRHTLRLLTTAVPPGSRVLDVAAAQGNFSLRLAERGYHVTWNDLRQDLIGYVELKHERGDVTFASGNVFDVDFPLPFDAVVMTEVIEHVAHPDRLLARVADLVKPGGSIVMTTPNGAYVRNRLPKFSECADPSVYERVQFKPDADGHIFLLHPDEIGPLAARAGLEVDELVLFTNPLTNGHLKTARLLRVMPRMFVEALEAATGRLPFALRRKALVRLGVRFRKPSRS